MCPPNTRQTQDPFGRPLQSAFSLERKKIRSKCVVLTSCCHSPLPNAVKVLMGCVSLDYLAYIPPRLSL